MRQASGNEYQASLHSSNLQSSGGTDTWVTCDSDICVPCPSLEPGRADDINPVHDCMLGGLGNQLDSAHDFPSGMCTAFPLRLSVLSRVALIKRACKPKIVCRVWGFASFPTPIAILIFIVVSSFCSLEWILVSRAFPSARRRCFSF